MCVEYPNKKKNHSQRIIIYREQKSQQKTFKKKETGYWVFFPSYKSLYRAVYMAKLSITVFWS